ncbi:MAG: SufD family Fe-S cluster assembly protein [Candidatus Niyogibacteria bacterium]|nr:SufD family Fe-S cluster assembly protein [Candidatus Niyogibacteria bacterium]
METLIVKGAENHVFTLAAGEERSIVCVAAESADIDIRATLASGARLKLIFLFAGNKDDAVRARLAVRHEGADSVSEVIARGVLYNRSSAAVDGSIYVSPGARGASARFEGKALLEGSGSAEILPTLEIKASDARQVRHAAAVSRLTPEERMYLESRGLDAEGSVRLAAEGFLKAPFSCAIEIPKEFDYLLKKNR